MNDITLDLPTGIYRITNEGKVYSQSKLKIPIVGKGMEHTGKFKCILKQERELTYTLNNRGYLSVGFTKKTFMVHRLVAEHFCSNPDNKSFVNHIDGNKLNNHFSNLEWCTIAENNAHARETGLHIQARGHKLKYKSVASKKKALANLKDKSKLTDNEVRYVRKAFIPRDTHFSATALARAFGTSVAAMAKIVNGETYKHVK